LVKGILIGSNKEPSPLERENNHKNGMGHLKIFFSRTTEPE
jgi:hypothetical protein